MVRVWDLRKGLSQLTINAWDHLVDGVCFADEGRLLVTVSAAVNDSHGHVRVWDARTGRHMHELEGHAQPVLCWEVSPDGQKLVTGSMDKTIKVWNVKSGQELLTHRGHRDEITDVNFTPDGQHILSSSADGLVMLWDATKTREPYHWRPGFANMVAFAPDGNRLAISVADKKTTGGQLATFTSWTHKQIA
jgi:WD40 repeat protein